MPAQNSGLPVEKFLGLVGSEPAEIEKRMRARPIQKSRIRSENLIETVVRQTPEGRAPFTVQNVNRFVSRLEPFAECLLSRRTVISRGVRFVVELPSPDCRVAPVTTRQFGNNSLRKAQVSRIGQSVVAGRAVFAASPVSAYQKCLGILFSHPCRGARSRCA